jgi:putative flippase GtrA
VANITATLFAFVTNKYFVFQSKHETTAQLIKEFVQFCIGRAFVFVEDLGISFLAIDYGGQAIVNFLHLDAIPFGHGLLAFGPLKSIIPTALAFNALFWTLFNQVFAIVFNYLVSKFIIFKDKK